MISSSSATSIPFKIVMIALKLFLGGMLFYGGIQKFGDPRHEHKTENAKAREHVASSQKMTFIMGMRQTGYFWELLGVMELLAGALILSQVYAVAGAFIALPLTLNIFLFHLFLERDEVGELVMTAFLVIINGWLILWAYEKWRGILADRTSLSFKQ